MTATTSPVPTFQLTSFSISSPDVKGEEPVAPHRISLSEMDTGKFAMLGSLMIVGMETALFPLNTIQTIIMSQRTKLKVQNTFKTTYEIVRTEGILRLWRGIVPQTIGALPGQACYYLAYETMHEKIGETFPSLEAGSFLRGFMAGACADLAGGIFYVPADIVAQRLQIQNSHSLSFSHNKRLYKGGWDVCKKIVQNEGPFGFWRGYAGYVTAFAPASAVQWGVYELCKILLFPFMARLNFKNSENLAIPLSGAIAGVCALTANNPLEVMRVRMQVMESRNKQDAEVIKRGYWYLGLQIYRKEGVRAFYRGLTARLLTTLPGIIVAMTGYEYIKDIST